MVCIITNLPIVRILSVVTTLLRLTRSVPAGSVRFLEPLLNVPELLDR